MADTAARSAAPSAALGHATGWDLVRQHLVGEDEQPMLFIADTRASEVVATVDSDNRF